MIGNGEVKPSPTQIEAVQRFPKPRCVKDIQKFLGLSWYFRKFIPQYSLIAKPLSDILKKNTTFQFGYEEESAFKKLKMVLSQDPVLKIYNPNYYTELHIDASIDGFGAILLQKNPDDDKLHSVYYSSKRTTNSTVK